MLYLSHSPRAPLRDDRIQIDGTVHSALDRTLSGVAVSGTYSEAFIINAMQSHLVNEFRMISGLTPSEYQRDITETRNLLSAHVAVRLSVLFFPRSSPSAFVG
jgi:hypothetical protein